MFRFEWDLRELNRYADNLAEGQLDAVATEILKESGKYFLEDVKKRTPVDTGNLRACWSSPENMAMTVSRNGDIQTITFTNEARNPRTKKGDDQFKMYASYVEEGYHTTGGRWIPGHWFVKASELKTEQHMAQTSRIKIGEWIERGEGM